MRREWNKRKKKIRVRRREWNKAERRDIERRSELNKRERRDERTGDGRTEEQKLTCLIYREKNGRTEILVRRREWNKAERRDIERRSERNKRERRDERTGDGRIEERKLTCLIYREKNGRAEIRVRRREWRAPAWSQINHSDRSWTFDRGLQTQRRTQIWPCSCALESGDAVRDAGIAE